MQSAATSGDSFFADGAEKASAALAQQLGLATTSQTVLTGAWNHQDLLDDFFQKSRVPDVGAIWAHYSHWLAQPATLPTPLTLADLATTADIDPAHYSYNGRLIFTVGCHSGLNLPDTLAAVAPGASVSLLIDNRLSMGNEAASSTWMLPRSLWNTGSALVSERDTVSSQGLI